MDSKTEQGIKDKSYVSNLTNSSSTTNKQRIQGRGNITLWGFIDQERATLKCSVSSLRLKEEIYESTTYKTTEVASIY